MDYADKDDSSSNNADSFYALRMVTDSESFAESLMQEDEKKPQGSLLSSATGKMNFAEETNDQEASSSEHQIVLSDLDCLTGVGRNVNDGKAETKREIGHRQHVDKSESNTTCEGSNVNEAYEDLKQTGQWGKITKKEMGIVASVILLVLAGAVAGIILLLTGTSSGGDSTDADTVKQESLTPPEFGSIEEQYKALLHDFSEIYIVNSVSKYLPDNFSEIRPSSYKSLNENTWIRTLSWILYEDKRPRYIDESKQRFACVFLYINFQGSNWFEQTNWLSMEHVCDWYGIDCVEKKSIVGSGDSSSSSLQTKKVIQLDLAHNNLNGTLLNFPFELLRDSIESLFFSSNSLKGVVPGSSLGTLPYLEYLYLQDNFLTGTIPISLLESGSLDTLFVHGNDLTGSWPEEFCPLPCSPDAEICDNVGPFREFGLNCRQTLCPEGCCDEFLNCF